MDIQGLSQEQLEVFKEQKAGILAMLRLQEDPETSDAMLKVSKEVLRLRVEVCKEFQEGVGFEDITKELHCLTF